MFDDWLFDVVFFLFCFDSIKNIFKETSKFYELVTDVDEWMDAIVSNYVFFNPLEIQSCWTVFRE